MTEEKVLVLGLGEIGRALFELLREKDRFTVYGLDLDEEKMLATQQDKNRVPKKIDTMHICFPCKDQNNFVSAVTSYENKFKPSLLIVNSTVPPGTTKKIQHNCQSLVAHSPVRGVHKSLVHMKWEIKRYVKYVGGVDVKAGEEASKHFEKLGLKTKTLHSCTETELAKLFETTYRAWMIVCYQEMHRISRTLGADFDNTIDFIENTHRVRLDRPILFPGFIAGHCLIPNTELLLKSYNSELLQLILKSNQKRKEEIKHKAIREEAEKIAMRVEAFKKDVVEKLKSDYQ